MQLVKVQILDMLITFNLLHLSFRMKSVRVTSIDKVPAESTRLDNTLFKAEFN